MGEHPDYVRGFNGTLDELARQVGNMTYDKTQQFVELLAADLKRQAEADLRRGRPRLSAKLYAAAESLMGAGKHLDDAWKICEPHTKKIKNDYILP